MVAERWESPVPETRGLSFRFLALRDSQAQALKFDLDL